MDPTARLRKIDPAKWTVDDVGTWLDYIHLSEHRAEFTKQSVSGSELVELDVDDLLELHVTKMGHRKKLTSHIKMLKHGLDGAYATNTDDGSSEGSTSGFTRTGGGSSAGSASSSGSKSSNTNSKAASDTSGKLNFKCYVGDDISVLHLSANISYNQLKSKLRKEYGAKMVVQYKDLDGDKIRIKKSSHLKAAINECQSSGVVKLYLRERKKKVSVREQSILDTMLDAVVTVNLTGRVCFFNTAAEKLFGYSRGEVIKQNVRMLMPNEVAEHHDQYLKNYQQTRVGKIIGSGRQVQAKHKDGHLFPVRLTVTESVQTTGDVIYTGTLTKVVEASTSSPSISAVATTSDAVIRNPMFDLLDKMLDATIVINEAGIIQFWNVASEAKFGWQKEEAIGRNIKFLMPKDVADVHDTYLKRYLETKSARIIGVGREVVAQRKDGSMFPVYLSVSEQALDAGRRLFTGIIRNVEQTVERTKTVLQQQREVVDGLSVAGIVIDQTGRIHAFNEAAQKLLGYRLIDIVSRNLSVLMPGEYARVHTDYITTYMKTGQAKVIGVGRDVPVVRKDGTLMAAHLTVTEKRDGEKCFFVGILQPK